MATVSSIVRCERHCQQLVQRLRCKLPSFWFSETPTDLCFVRRHLLLQSSSDLPPVSGAMYGLGTEPLNLYKSVAFDSLHVLDLGLIRSFIDPCVEHFMNKKYTSLPASQCVSLANDRLQHLPRGAHLPKACIFFIPVSRCSLE